MTTISVPIDEKMEKFINSQIEKGTAENKAQVVRKALSLFAEEQALMEVLESQSDVKNGRILKFTNGKSFEKQLREMYD